MTRLGFIGTGHLASFFVEGLLRAGADYAITVSPRNAKSAAKLKERFGVSVAESNQAVIDASDLIVLCVRPSDAEHMLLPLKFGPDQTVLSVMAGVSLAKIAAQVTPATAAVGMMPGLANAIGAGPSALHPGNAVAGEMLSNLGPVHVYDDERVFAAASVMGAFSGMSILLMKELIAWFIAQGLEPGDARNLVAETFEGNAQVFLEGPLSPAGIAQGVATPGGITEQGWKIVMAGGSWEQALDAVLRRMVKGA